MKILYFDYWTKGLPHNILPLDRLLAARGFERVMVHVGSWRDPSVKDEEIIEGLLCRDIRWYSGDLRRVFATEKPTVVHVLNVGGVVDRLVNRICRNLNVKTVFLMHGVMPLGKNINVEKKRLNEGFTIAKRLAKAPKYLKIYAMYLGEVARTSPLELLSPRTYGHIAQMILSPGSVYADPWIHKDLYPDLTLLYSEAYRRHFVETLRFNPDSIRVVGNPQLDPVFQFARASDSQERMSKLYGGLGIPLDKPLVVFLVDGLDSGLSSFTEAEWLEELREVSAVVRSVGARLILKLHPTNSRTKVEAAFQSIPDTHILQHESNLSIVTGAAAVVGHISSSLVIPIALKIPVFVPQWSKVYREYDYYVSYGAALPALTSDTLKRHLRSVIDKTFNYEFNGSYNAEFVGFSDGTNWERITNEILTFCNK